jgi:hypothetical protein
MAGKSDLDLLFLYDGDMSWLERSVGRFDADLAIAVEGGIKGLKKVFDRFLAEGKTFKRVMFETHGYPGMIFFGDEKNNCQIDSAELTAEFTGYDALFPKYTRMYFAGCNVAEDEAGWQFLETAGKTFLTRAGGLTFGWTSAGFAIGTNLVGLLSSPIYMLVNSGKVWHAWGDARYVWTGPGGSPTVRYTK